MSKKSKNFGQKRFEYHKKRFETFECNFLDDFSRYLTEYEKNKKIQFSSGFIRGYNMESCGKRWAEKRGFEAGHRARFKRKGK